MVVTTDSLAADIASDSARESTAGTSPCCARVWQTVEISVIALTFVYPLTLVAITISAEKNAGYALYLLPLPLIPILLWRSTRFPKECRPSTTTEMSAGEEPHADLRPITFLSLFVSSSFGYLYVILMLCAPLMFRQAYSDLDGSSGASANSTSGGGAAVATPSNTTAEGDGGAGNSWLSSTLILNALKMNLIVLFLGVMSREHFSASSIVANRDLIMRAVLDNLDIFNLASLLGEPGCGKERIAPKGSALEIAILVTTSLAFLVPYIFSSELFTANSIRRQYNTHASAEFVMQHLTNHRIKPRTRAGLLNVRLVGMPLAHHVAMGKVKREIRHRPSKMEVLRNMNENERDLLKHRLILAISPAALYAYSLFFVSLPFVAIRLYVMIAYRVQHIEFVIKDVIGIALAMMNIHSYWSSSTLSLPDFLTTSVSARESFTSRSAAPDAPNINRVTEDEEEREQPA